jgi:non-homologous end joining protein Ku
MTFNAQANAPTRASNSVTLAWGGLINIALSVFSGTEATNVSRKEFVKGTDVPVGRANIRKDNGAIIESVDDVVRKAQATNGTWVEFNNDEVAAATCPAGQAEIVSFVPVKQVGQYLTQDVVQVRPKATKGKVDPAAAKAFALFTTALRKTRTVALVKIALRGPARYGLLTPEGDLLYIYTADAVREGRPVDDGFKFSAQETNLAVSLIESIGVDAPVITDDTAEAVQKAVDIKAAGQPAPTPTEPQASTDDLLAALQASIANKQGKGTAA